jgi:hypothetical protein
MSINGASTHSIYNVVHNAEFFFNASSFKGDKLLSQLMHVVTCYEFIECKIYGICSDAHIAHEEMMKDKALMVEEFLSCVQLHQSL